MKEAIKLFYSNYFNLKGRTGKQAYKCAMWFFLSVIVVAFVLMLTIRSLAIIKTIAYLYTAFFWASLCPLIAINVRRAHDMGKSGAFVLIWLFSIPVGFLFIELCGRLMLNMNMTRENMTMVAVAGVIIVSAAVIMNIFFSKESDGENAYGRPGEEKTNNEKMQYEASGSISNSENEKKKVCWSCGSIISFDAVHCPKCGEKQNQ